MNKLIVLFSFFIGSYTLISCDEKHVFDQYKNLPNQWNRDSIVQFEIQSPDSLKSYDLFINLRNTNDYPYSNIYLIAEINYPNGRVVQDTLEYEMAYPDGQWMGIGFSESKASKLWYKKNINFEEEGVYTFNIRQAMRKAGSVEGDKNLKGITEVGLRIEYAN